MLVLHSKGLENVVKSSKKSEVVEERKNLFTNTFKATSRMCEILRLLVLHRSGTESLGITSLHS